MRITLEMIDDLLPVCRENVPVVAMKSLVDLNIGSVVCYWWMAKVLHLPKLQYRIREQAHNPGLKAGVISV